MHQNLDEPVTRCQAPYDNNDRKQKQMNQSRRVNVRGVDKVPRYLDNLFQQTLLLYYDTSSSNLGFVFSLTPSLLHVPTPTLHCFPPPLQISFLQVS